MIFKKRISTSMFLLSSVVASLCVLSALPSAQGKIWQIPEGATDEHNPLAPAADVLKKGASLYSSQCAKCHGPKGLGDGPDANQKDAARRPANLTASRTLEGVMFYKIWNGRKDPEMPAFKSQMTKDEVWAVVAFVKSLSAAPGAH
jgi:mono/diheme cytochrome c family protein